MDDLNIQRDLGRVEGKLDLLISMTVERAAKTDMRLNALENQMMDVRSVQAKGHGMTAAIGAAAGVAMWGLGLVWDKVVSS
jgi:hypothetical protein